MNDHLFNLINLFNEWHSEIEYGSVNNIQRINLKYLMKPPQKINEIHLLNEVRVLTIKFFPYWRDGHLQHFIALIEKEKEKGDGWIINRGRIRKDNETVGLLEERNQ